MRPFIIGITGGIASGKSTVCNFLKHEGFTVISSDQIGHEVLSYPEIVNKIKKEFSQNIISDKKIDRNLLRKIVFEHPEALKKLNSIVHPEILKVMDDIVDHSSHEYLFFEVPLLFESGMQNCFDFIILISVTPEIQLQRLMDRNSYDEKEADAIINSQLPDKDKMPNSGLVIINNGSEENLENKIWNFIKLMYQLKKRDLKRFDEIL